MCICVCDRERETEERGTDWYVEGKDAAGETSEASEISGEYGSRAIIRDYKGRLQSKAKNWQQTINKLSDRENDDSEEGKRKEMLLVQRLSRSAPLQSSNVI